jgi:spoIIIJ-associated protein
VEPLRSEEIRKGVSLEGLDPGEFGGLDPVDCLLRMIDGLGFYGEIDDIVAIEGGYLIALHSEDPGRLIGRHGTVLNELQFLLNRMVQKGARGSVPRLILDVDGYRDRQEERLIDMALDAAERVRRWGHPIRIEPLNAYERRIVHNTLKSDPDIETISPNMADPDGRKQITVRMVK